MKLNNRIIQNHRGFEFVVKNEITDYLEEQMKQYGKNTNKFLNHDDSDFEHFFTPVMVERGFNEVLTYSLVVGGTQREGGLSQRDEKIESVSVSTSAEEFWLNGRYARYHENVKSKLKDYTGAKSDLPEYIGRAI